MRPSRSFERGAKDVVDGSRSSRVRRKPKRCDLLGIGPGGGGKLGGVSINSMTYHTCPLTQKKLSLKKHPKGRNFSELKNCTKQAGQGIEVSLPTMTAGHTMDGPSIHLSPTTAIIRPSWSIQPIVRASTRRKRLNRGGQSPQALTKFEGLKKNRRGLGLS